MSRKYFQNKAWLAILSGIVVFLAFPKFYLIPTVFFFPILFNLLIIRCSNFKESFAYGFLTSFIIMLGGFYWVTYVIHEFGEFSKFGVLSWPISALLYLGFCGFGALNFPLYVIGASFGYRTLLKKAGSQSLLPYYFSVGLPSLFTLVEFFIPKLFPWFIGHCLYLWPRLIQIVDITGTTILTFGIYHTSSTLSLFFINKQIGLSQQLSKKILLLPIVFWGGLLLYGSYRKLEKREYDTLRVALVQANIGSLLKVESRLGGFDKVRFVVDKYFELTERSLEENPQIILWPETAMPFYLIDSHYFGQNVIDKTKNWNIPLISGGYSKSPKPHLVDYNSAYLLEPSEPGSSLYHKNVLLAFGEYMPLGELFPKLYEWFPQVSRFDRGSEQPLFILKGPPLPGLRVGVTLCYEAIIPSFVRKVVKQGPQILINLTNDSWFGPTSEPYQHGALSVFRAIEHHLPLLRVTNTGLSFTVDDYGSLQKSTTLFGEDFLVDEIHIPKNPKPTLYGRWGDWFVGMLLILFLLSFRRASISI